MSLRNYITSMPLCQRRRLVAAGIEAVLALAIMGGFGYALLRGMDYLLRVMGAA